MSRFDAGTYAPIECFAMGKPIATAPVVTVFVIFGISG